jgi:hypothetical protein
MVLLFILILHYEGEGGFPFLEISFLGSMSAPNETCRQIKLEVLAAKASWSPCLRGNGDLHKVSTVKFLNSSIPSFVLSLFHTPLSVLP